MGDLDTGLRVRNPLGGQLEPNRGPARLVAVGVAGVIALVIAVFWVAGHGSGPPKKDTTTGSGSSSPGGWRKGQDAGKEATVLVFTWAVPVGLGVWFYDHRRRKRLEEKAAEVELRKRQLVGFNDRGQLPVALAFVEGDAKTAVHANTQHQRVRLAEAERPIVPKVHTYAPRIDGPRGDGFDPLEDGRDGPPPLEKFTALDLARADVPNEERLCVGMDDDGNLVFIPYKAHGGALIFGKGRYGKSTAAKTETWQVLHALGDVVSIDPDREKDDGFSRGLGYGLPDDPGGYDPGADLTRQFLMPPARTPEEIAELLDAVQGFYQHLQSSQGRTFLLFVIDELFTLLQTKPVEFLPKELRERLIALVGDLLSHGPKYGIFVVGISHGAHQKDSGGSRIRPQALTAYLFNMESGQARMVIDPAPGEVLPETGRLRVGECWVRFIDGRENRLVKVRTPECPSHELAELAALIAERRVGGRRPASGLIVPARELWTPDARSLAAPPAPALVGHVNGNGAAPALDSRGGQVAIEQAEPLPDPKNPHATVDKILHAFFELKMEPGKIVEAYWDKKFHGGQGRTQKIAVVTGVIRDYPWKGAGR